MNKILIPDTLPLLETCMDVSVNDLNYGNHLSNDSVLRFMNETRIRFLRLQGYRDELDVEGMGMIMSDVEVRYLSEGFLGDQVLIKLYATIQTPRKWDFIYEMSNETTGRKLAVARSGMMCFDYDERKVMEIPDRFAMVLRGGNKW